MKDYLVRIITKSGSLRAMACVSTGLTAEACRRHNTLPLASIALGRALTGGVLMAALLKTGQRLALKFEGNGPLRKILVEADKNGTVCGTVGVPTATLPERDGKLDLAGAIGRAGLLTVTKDLGVKESYPGVVELVSSEIGEDLAWYLTSSEQIPSAVGLGTFLDGDGRVVAAGGFLVQALPPQDDAAIDLLMERIAGLPTLSHLLLQGTTPEQLLERLFAGIPYDLLEKQEIAFHCSCSREKAERVFLTMGRDELQRLLDEQGGAEITCEFCRERYPFDRQSLNGLLDEMAAATAAEREKNGREYV